MLLARFHFFSPRNTHGTRHPTASAKRELFPLRHDPRLLNVLGKAGREEYYACREKEIELSHDDLSLNSTPVHDPSLL